jgi:hypothetical protein
VPKIIEPVLLKLVPARGLFEYKVEPDTEIGTFSANEADLAFDANEADVALVANEADVALVANEADVALVANEADVALVANEALIDELTCGKEPAKLTIESCEVVVEATTGKTSVDATEVTIGNSVIFTSAIV